MTTRQFLSLCLPLCPLILASGCTENTVRHPPSATATPLPSPSEIEQPSHQEGSTNDNEKLPRGEQNKDTDQAAINSMRAHATATPAPAKK